MTGPEVSRNHTAAAGENKELQPSSEGFRIVLKDEAALTSLLDSKFAKTQCIEVFGDDCKGGLVKGAELNLFLPGENDEDLAGISLEYAPHFSNKIRADRTYLGDEGAFRIQELLAAMGYVSDFEHPNFDPNFYGVNELVLYVTGSSGFTYVVLLGYATKAEYLQDLRAKTSRTPDDDKFIRQDQSGRVKNEIIIIGGRHPLRSPEDAPGMSASNESVKEFAELCQSLTKALYQHFEEPEPDVTLELTVPDLDLIKARDRAGSDVVNPYDMEKASLEEEVVILDERTVVRLDDVRGQPTAVEAIRRLLKQIGSPSYFEEGYMVLPAKAALFWGPPGVGKTMLARALAHEVGGDLETYGATEINNQWFGNSEKNVKMIFDRAKKKFAETGRHQFIFLDEFDAIGRERSGEGSGGTAVAQRIVNQFLIEMDGLKVLEGVHLIMATNRPDIVDPALMRPGRIGERIEFKMPDIDGRRDIFEHYVNQRVQGVAFGQVIFGTLDFNAIAASSEGMSGADIKGVVDTLVTDLAFETYDSEKIDPLKEQVEAIEALVSSGNSSQEILSMVRALLQEVAAEPEQVEDLGLKPLTTEDFLRVIAAKRKESAMIAGANDVSQRPIGFSLPR